MKLSDLPSPGQPGFPTREQSRLCDEYRDVSQHDDWWEPTVDLYVEALGRLGATIAEKPPVYFSLFTQGSYAHLRLTGRFSAQDIADNAAKFREWVATEWGEGYVPAWLTKLQARVDAICTACTRYSLLPGFVDVIDDFFVRSESDRRDERYVAYTPEADTKLSDARLVAFDSEIAMVSMLDELCTALRSDLEDESLFQSSDEAVWEWIESNHEDAELLEMLGIEEDACA